MRFKYELPSSIWLALLTILLEHFGGTLSLNCDKTFTYYEDYGQNSFNVTCSGITKGYEYILENITINNEISLTITNSVLENLSPNIFRNVRSIRMLSVYNSTLQFDRQLPIFNKLDKLEDLVIEDTRFVIENVTLQGLVNLKTLEIRNNSLSVIKIGGFKHLSNLETLQIVKNQVKNLEDLQLCELPRLKTLILSNNLISDVKLFYFICQENTESLDFSINDMPAIPNIYQHTYFNVTTMAHNLIDLDLSYNNISDIGFCLESLSKLRFLNIGYNKLGAIKRMHFKSLERLEKCSLKNNKILSFESNFFNNKTRLNLVDLSYNFLKEINVSNVPRLQILNLSYNNLNSILLSNLTSLQKVDLKNNNLQDLLSDAFVDVPKLVNLNLAGNKLVLSQGLFQNIQGLKYLVLNNNSLKNVPEKVFLGLTNLKNLDLSNNDIVSINVNTFHDLVNLEVLNLSNNSIESVSYLALEPLKSLRSLDVAANKLQYIEYDVILSRLPGLTNINIKSNLLTCDSLSKIITFLKQKNIGYTNSENPDLAKMNQNVAGIPCRAAKSIMFTVESRSTASSALVNSGISIVTVLAAILTAIVVYKFYIYLKRRRYRADEFELVNE